MENCNIQIEVENPHVQMKDIERLINEKKRYILGKRKEISEKKKLNNFLNGIENDYNKFYNHIYNEKLEQKKSMQLLLDYLNTLSNNQKLIEEEDLLLEKNRNMVLGEIDVLKNELEEIIS